MCLLENNRENCKCKNKLTGRIYDEYDNELKKLSDDIEKLLRSKVRLEDYLLSINQIVDRGCAQNYNQETVLTDETYYNVYQNVSEKVVAKDIRIKELERQKQADVENSEKRKKQKVDDEKVQLNNIKIKCKNLEERIKTLEQNVEYYKKLYDGEISKKYIFEKRYKDLEVQVLSYEDNVNILENEVEELNRANSCKNEESVKLHKTVNNLKRIIEDYAKQIEHIETAAEKNEGANKADILRNEEINCARCSSEQYLRGEAQMHEVSKGTNTTLATYSSSENLLHVNQFVLEENDKLKNEIEDLIGKLEEIGTRCTSTFSEKEDVRTKYEDLLVEFSNLSANYNSVLEDNKQKTEEIENFVLVKEYQDERIEELNERVNDLQVEQSRQLEEANKEIKEYKHLEEEYKYLRLSYKQYKNRANELEEMLHKYFPIYESLNDVKKNMKYNVGEEELGDEVLIDDITKMYGDEIHKLEVDNESLMKNVKDINRRMDYYKFKKNVSKCKAEIKTLENNHAENIVESVNKIVTEIDDKLLQLFTEASKNIEYYHQRVSGKITKSSIYQNAMNKVQELLSMLTKENQLMKSFGSNVSEESDESSQKYFGDDVYVIIALGKIDDIHQNVQELEKRVDKFRGTRKEKEYLDLEHKLTECTYSVDRIQVKGVEIIQKRRKDLISYIMFCLEKLEDNVTH